jgi:diamine N-acetyltransferase
MQIAIRPLKISDASISWKWRNDPHIWKLTGRKWNNKVTKQMEEQWLEMVLLNKNEKRFAICVNKNKKYVGNVQLTDIKNSKAQFHIFIGEKSYWGKGIATKATKLILDYGFDMLKLNEVYLYVKKDNLAAINAYKKCGFTIKEIRDDGIFMKICENGRK